jgi:carbonic anhydrase
MVRVSLGRTLALAISLVLLNGAALAGEPTSKDTEGGPASARMEAPKPGKATEEARPAKGKPADEGRPAKGKAADEGRPAKDKAAEDERPAKGKVADDERPAKGKAAAAEAEAEADAEAPRAPPVQVRKRPAPRAHAPAALLTHGHGDIPGTALPGTMPVAAQAVVAATPANRGIDTHAPGSGAPHWAYEGEGGPATWAQLAPEYAACGSGQRQSPIDIRDGIKLELDPIAIDYRETPFRVIDNGHTVQVNVPAGNFIKVMGRRFALVQFHFHRPSEELIDGHQSEMVIHLVHKDADGKLAVIAILLERGARQSEVQAVWNNLPLERNEEQAASGRIDLAHLLPEDRRYYTYMGSLTTPPCTEGVLWVVMKQPIQASAAQIDLFARLYPYNARPVQASSGRMIKESN